MNDEEYMEIAYQEALKALEYDDVPVKKLEDGV